MRLCVTFPGQDRTCTSSLYSDQCGYPFSSTIVSYKMSPLTSHSPSLTTILQQHLYQSKYLPITKRKQNLSDQNMPPRPLQSLTTMMILTGILLVPTAVPHAVQDLQDLKSIIDSAATTINAAPNNSSWGFFSPASPAGAMGTADLVANITTTVLRASYFLNVNKVSGGCLLCNCSTSSGLLMVLQIAWITTPNTTNTTNLTTTSPTTSTTPDQTTSLLTASPPLPTTLPANTTLDEPYLAYINSIPNLSSALTTLGRSWHKELNKPVWEAIDALQQIISTFSSDMLAAELIHSQAILRSIRVSSSLEDAQQAWSRVLNLPGAKGVGRRAVLEGWHGKVEVQEAGGRLSNAEFYTHKDLWGRAPVAEAGVKLRRGEVVE